MESTFCAVTMVVAEACQANIRTNGEGINTKVEMLRREGVGLAENPKGGYLIAREELEARLWVAQP